jgi:hypothetical protein
MDKCDSFLLDITQHFEGGGGLGILITEDTRLPLFLDLGGS